MSGIGTPSDSLCTPDFILWRVRNLGTIALDACSNPQSRVNAEIELSLEAGDDGLAADWLATCTTGLAFINPPYGRGHLRPWTAKIAAEAARGCEIVSLLPNDTTTQWWATVNGTCQARCDIARRVAFIGGAHKSGTLKSSVFYHGPRRFLFAHHFEALGEVSVYDRRR